MLYLGMFRHASNLPSGFGTEYLFLLRLHSVSLGGSVCLLYPFLIWDTVRTEPSSIAPGEAAQGQQRAAHRPTGKPQNLSEAWFGSVSKSWDAFLKLIQTYLRLFGLGIGLKPRRIVTCYFLIPSPAFLCLLVLAKLGLQRKIVIHGGTQ